MTGDQQDQYNGVDSIAADERPKAGLPDSRAEKESEKFDYDAEQDKKIKDLHIEGLKQDIKERKDYANKIFKLISFWLVAVLVILILQGCDCAYFELSDQVLITLLGGTTINVLGLFVIVASYLFPKGGNSIFKK